MPGVWVFPGGGVDPADGDGEAGYRACAVRELAEEASIELPADEELVLFSRWITPEVISRRFDAWFFLALAPAHTPPKAGRGRDGRRPLVRAAGGARRAGGGRARPRLPDDQPSSGRCCPVRDRRRGARGPPRPGRSSRSCPRSSAPRRTTGSSCPATPTTPALALAAQRAGMPLTLAPGATSSMTTAPAPTTASSPISTPGRIFDPGADLAAAAEDRRPLRGARRSSCGR